MQTPQTKHHEMSNSSEQLGVSSSKNALPNSVLVPHLRRGAVHVVVSVLCLFSVVSPERSEQSLDKESMTEVQHTPTTEVLETKESWQVCRNMKRSPLTDTSENLCLKHLTSCQIRSRHVSILKAVFVKVPTIQTCSVPGKRLCLFFPTVQNTAGSIM